MSVGLLGAYAFATWAWVFYKLIHDGEIRLLEPVRWIAISEFIMAIVYGVVCLMAFLLSFKGKE